MRSSIRRVCCCIFFLSMAMIRQGSSIVQLVTEYFNDNDISNTQILRQESSTMQLVLGIALETIAKLSQIEEEEKDALSFGFVFIEIHQK